MPAIRAFYVRVVIPDVVLSHQQKKIYKNTFESSNHHIISERSSGHDHKIREIW